MQHTSRIRLKGPDSKQVLSELRIYELIHLGNKTTRMILQHQLLEAFDEEATLRFNIPLYRQVTFSNRLFLFKFGDKGAA